MRRGYVEPVIDQVRGWIDDYLADRVEVVVDPIKRCLHYSTAPYDKMPDDRNYGDDEQQMNQPPANGKDEKPECPEHYENQRNGEKHRKLASVEVNRGT